LSCAAKSLILSRRDCRVSAMASIVLGIVAAYAVLGLIVAVAFAIAGVTQVQPAPVSVPARLLILPGAAALWPLILSRWIKARRP
jgi:hypothetical protein